MLHTYSCLSSRQGLAQCCSSGPSSTAKHQLFDLSTAAITVVWGLWSTSQTALSSCTVAHTSTSLTSPVVRTQCSDPFNVAFLNGLYMYMTFESLGILIGTCYQGSVHCAYLLHCIKVASQCTCRSLGARVHLWAELGMHSRELLHTLCCERNGAFHGAVSTRCLCVPN